MHPQTSDSQQSQASTLVTVRSLRLVRERDGNPAIEIISTQPLVPSIRAIENPYRVVIDLPNSRLAVPQKRISIEADQISTLRADQFQEKPPVARVVVDLLAPRPYTWEARGNRLVVHLGKPPRIDATKSPFEPPSVPSLTAAPKPVVARVEMAGPVALIGSGTISGSSISAGGETAVVGLARGGEVYVCPGTTLSVTPAQNGHNVMLAFNTGAFEAHYALDASSDSIVTPDFRILLPGPGEFHLAVSSDNRGNTCVRALPGNTASAIVSELMGDRTYQVKATDQLVFRAGRLEQVDMLVPIECGCSPARQPVLRAENSLPVLKQATAAPHPAATGESAVPELRTSADTPGTRPATAAERTPASPHPKDIQVEVEAPFVFRAGDPPAAPVEQAKALPFSFRVIENPPLTTPLGPPAPQPRSGLTSSPSSQQHRGFFGRLGSLFAALFR